MMRSQRHALTGKIGWPDAPAFWQLNGFGNFALSAKASSLLLNRKVRVIRETIGIRSAVCFRVADLLKTSLREQTSPFFHSSSGSACAWDNSGQIHRSLVEGL